MRSPKRFSICLGLLVFGAALAAPANPQWPADAQWKESRRNGGAAREQGQYSEARRWFETALAQAPFDTTDLRRADLDDELAGMCEVLGDEAAAENLYADALKILAAHPKDGADVRTIVLGGLGVFRARQGRLKEAGDFLSQAMESAAVAFSESDPRLASIESSLGQINVLRGESAVAESLLRNAIKIQKAAPGAFARDRILSETSLGALYTNQGRFAEAELLLSAANAEASHLENSRPTYAGTMTALADLYRLEGKASRGEPLLRKAQAIYETAFGPDSPRVGEVLLDRSLDSLSARKPAIAEDEINRALNILRKTEGTEHPTVAIGETRLAQAYAQQGRFAKAELLLRHALPVQEKTWPGGHFLIGDCLLQLAGVQQQQQNYLDAELNYRKAIEAYEKTGSAGKPGLATALRQYAKMLRPRRGDEAKILEKRAQEVQKGVEAFR